MNTKQEYYIGTDLKFRIDIAATGFAMDTDDFVIDLYSGKSHTTLTKDDLIYVSDLDAESSEDGEGLDAGWYLTVNTDDYAPGMLWMSVRAHVPDDDFSAGYRREVAVAPLCEIRRVEMPTWAEKFL